MRKELLLGCGSRTDKVLEVSGEPGWHDLIRVDINPAHEPDVLWNLECYPWPFDDNAFDECHAYEVIEHVSGQQGDAQAFFCFFAEVYRILKPEGVLCASVPDFRSQWAWGDPSHKRVITPGSLIFLDQREYAQVGKTAISDFRHLWKGDFQAVFGQTQGESFYFALKAVK